MNEQPMHSVALGDYNHAFNDKGTEHKITSIEYLDEKVVTTITPPHELASEIMRKHVLGKGGGFNWKEFIEELSEAVKRRDAKKG